MPVHIDTTGIWDLTLDVVSFSAKPAVTGIVLVLSNRIRFTGFSVFSVRSP